MSPTWVGFSFTQTLGVDIKLGFKKIKVYQMHMFSWAFHKVYINKALELK